MDTRNSLRLPISLLLLLLAVFSPSGELYAQHGVVREYAALAPLSNAVPLTALTNLALTDTSITRGPDGAFYMTGSVMENGKPVGHPIIFIWRSPDLKKWEFVRGLSTGQAYYICPEIHYLKRSFWVAAEVAGGGGTDLIKFRTLDLATSDSKAARITREGKEPSLFLDDDGSLFWVMGAGQIARLQPDFMQGLAEKLSPPVTIRIAGPAGQQREQTVENVRGAHLAKINGKYYLFLTARLKRQGLGRTGLPEGVDDVLVAGSERPDSGYGDFYVAFPNAGQTTLFRDSQGAWWATWSGRGERAILQDQPAAFRIEQVPAAEARWPIGFAANEKTTRFPFALMLRPDTAFIYERGMGSARAVPLDIVPGQKAATPWIRDTFIMVAHDGNYYLTGTSGNMDGINLWRSADLRHFQFVKQVWTPDADPGRWYNDAPKRLFWAPELHRLKGTYWIPFCLSAGSRGKNGLLKSTSGLPEGPYELAFPENKGVDQHIDSSLFQDDDGRVYYVWQDGKIRKLNPAMDGFDGEARMLLPTDGQRVGYEGATLVKIGNWYVLTAAEWNGGGNRTDGTYDMMYSCSTNLWGPYLPRRVAVPHAGHGALFKDKNGRWNASFFGNDRTAPFRAMPGFVPVDILSSSRDLFIRPATGPL